MKIFHAHFSFICPYCEERSEIIIRLFDESSIQYFDCPSCLGGLGVLTDELAASFRSFSFESGSFKAEKTVYVFQVQDVPEDDLELAPCLVSFEDLRQIPIPRLLPGGKLGPVCPN